MVNNDLLVYVKQQRNAGVEQEEIKKILLERGWQETDVNEALTAAEQATDQPYAAPVSFTQTSAVGGGLAQNKKILIPAFITAGALLIGGAAFAAYYFTSSPEKLVGRVLDKINKTTSVKFAADLNVEFPAPAYLDFPATDDAERTGKMKLSFTGGADESDPADPKFQMTGRVFVSGLSQDRFELNLDLAGTGKKVFFKLSNLPKNEYIDTSIVNDRWILMDTAQLQDSLGASSAINPLGPGLFSGQLKPEQREQLIQSVQKNQVIKIKQKLGDEKIEGEPTQHYRLAFDQAGLVAFLADAVKIMGLPETGQAPDLPAEAEKLLNDLNFEAWIGKKDSLPYKLIVSSDLPESLNGATGKFEYTINFHDYNKPVIVDIPENAINFEDLFDELLKNDSGPQDYDITGDPSDRDARRVADVRQIMTALELFFNDNARYPKDLNGMPDPNDGAVTFTTYIKYFPFAPTPADGNCTLEENKYLYKLVNDGEYKLTFCLGASSGGLGSGLHSAGPAGFDANLFQNIAPRPLD
ncbi:MAG: hypothetical protein HY397_02905 [Candidatus Doudnabacteria bacterium]|nr:hypothetical protein [Candidatus Doudnabacteria bacterium]